MKAIDSLTFQQIRHLSDDDARKAFETIRWPEGVTCPRCQGKNILAVTGGRTGLYRCTDCRKAKTVDQFTVTVGSIFEDSHIPLGKWLMGFHLVCASKKGVSALQLQRQLELGSYRSAWHMAHRIRHAMASDPMKTMLKGVVEADETYIGGKPRNRKKRDRYFGGKPKIGRGTDKAPVLALIERGGRALAFAMDNVKAKSLRAAIDANVDKSSTFNTDEFPAYKAIGAEFEGGHQTVVHSRQEYAKPDGSHINTCESFFGLLKRGVHGTFHHIGRQHLGRYCDEFEFRWDHRKVTDGTRTVSALRRATGRRLPYRDLAGKMSV